MNEPSLNGHRPTAELPDELATESNEDVRDYLKGWRHPAADLAARAQLLTVLHTEAAIQFQLPIRQRRSMRHALLILQAQIRVIHWGLWIASALVIALGAVVSLAFQSQDGSSLPLTIVAPIVAAFGVAFLYGMDSDPAIELVLATPISPRLIVLARLTLVFGFNLLLTACFSVLLALARSEFSLIALIFDWLAPMTLLSGMAFLLSAMLFDPLASGLISLCLWIAVVARHYDITLGGDVLRFLPDLLRADLRFPMLLVGTIVFVLAFLRIQTEERWMEG